MSNNASRLLFVVSSLSMGGPQKSLIALLQRLDPNQFSVSLIVLDPSRAELRSFVPAHVSIIETPSIWSSATLPKSSWCRAVGSLLHSLPTSLRWKLAITLLHSGIKRLPGQQIRQRAWKVIGPHLPKIEQEFDIAVGILGLSTYAVVDLIRADHKFHWVRSDSSMLNRDQSLEDEYFSSLSGAIAVSPQVARIYEEMYPRMEHRVRVYKNDVLPPSQESVAKDGESDQLAALSLLTIARLDPLKGIDIAIGACHRLLEMGWNVNWTVLGDGPERSRLEELIRKRGLEEVFTLPGVVFDVQEELFASDIYVHPSRVEGRSNAVEEARGAGKAIVAVRYSTVTDQVEDGIDGLVCDIDSESLAITIAKLAHDPVLRSELGQEAARRYMQEREDPNRMIHSLLEGRFDTV